MKSRTTKIAAGLAALAALALGGAAIANATQGGGGKLTQSEASKASAAALRATGGGEVQAYERDNEDGATYEVEVRKPDGSVVDVRLDASFDVVVIDGDQETNDDDDDDAGEDG
jgi:Peptidase propeptide and YPEB domain